MPEDLDPSDELGAGEWEPWLAQRFVAYLLHDAQREPRPSADVERALARLTQQPDALSRLASVAFLLDPMLRLEEWLRDDVPPFLRRIRVRSESVSDLRRGSVRGRVDWARTLAVRNATRDLTWAASRSLHRTFDTPELVVVRQALDTIRHSAQAVLRAEKDGRSGWTGMVAEMASVAAATTAHSALHAVPLRVPTPQEWSSARASQDPIVRHAARILDAHAALLPVPDGEHLRDALSRCGLFPLNDDVRFQVFVMLSFIECIDALVAPARRVDSIVASGRAEVACWRGDDFLLKLHYDQAADRGVHSDVMQHYFGRSQSLRPDLRLELVRSGRTRELLADAKRSTSSSYLADAHHKMHGYLADRPHAFVDCTPKALVVCPAAGVGAPRPGDDVVFLGSGAHSDGTLRAALATWWTSTGIDGG